jgi:hypothetical protein
MLLYLSPEDGFGLPTSSGRWGCEAARSGGRVPRGLLELVHGERRNAQVGLRLGQNGYREQTQTFGAI